MVESNNEGKAGMPAEAEKKKEQTVPFYKLFSFADKYDYLLMSVGSLGAFIHGSAMPFFFLTFGQMVNGFSKNQSDLTTMTHRVSKYALYFVYLGLAGYTLTPSRNFSMELLSGRWRWNFASKSIGISQWNYSAVVGDGISSEVEIERRRNDGNRRSKSNRGETKSRSASEEKRRRSEKRRLRR